MNAADDEALRLLAELRPDLDLRASTTTAPDRDSLRAKYQPKDWARLLDPDRPPREWVIDDLIPVGASVSIVAPAKSGKTSLVRSACMAVALGWPNFGGLPIAPANRRVIYVDLENGDEDWSEDLEQLGIGSADLPRLNDRFGVIDTQPPPLDTESGGLEFLAIIEAFEVGLGDLLVLDSAQRVVADREDSSDTWRNFYRFTGKPLKERGLTVVRLDNTGKAAERGARGSSSKRDDVDLEWQLKRAPGSATIELDATAARLTVSGKHAMTRREVPGVGVRYSGAVARNAGLEHGIRRALVTMSLGPGCSQRAALQAVEDLWSSSMAPSGPKPSRAAVRDALRGWER